jgi:hypothetical protein
VIVLLFSSPLTVIKKRRYIPVVFVEDDYHLQQSQLKNSYKLGTLAVLDISGGHQCWQEASICWLAHDAPVGEEGCAFVYMHKLLCNVYHKETVGLFGVASCKLL